MTTVEMKYGIYVTFSMNERYFFDRTVFKSSARMIGSGKPATSEYSASLSVLKNTRSN